MSDEVIRPVSVSEQVADIVRARIFEGRLAPGERIRQETLAADLGISRTPARDALRALQAEGLLTTDANGYTTVIEITRSRAEDMYRLRQVIDGFAAYQATQKGISNKMAAELQKAVDLGVSYAREGKTREFHIINSEFHMLVLKATQNEFLISHEASLVRNSSLIAFPMLARHSARMIESAEEHQRIFEAIQSGDCNAARQCAEDHITAVVEYFLNSPISDSNDYQVLAKIKSL